MVGPGKGSEADPRRGKPRAAKKAEPTICVNPATSSSRPVGPYTHGLMGPWALALGTMGPEPMHYSNPLHIFPSKVTIGAPRSMYILHKTAWDFRFVRIDSPQRGFGTEASLVQSKWTQGNSSSSGQPLQECGLLDLGHASLTFSFGVGPWRWVFKLLFP